MVSHRNLEFNEAYNKALAWFFAFPEDETSLSDLSAKLKISKTTSSRIVKRLLRDGFLNRKVFGRVWRISANRTHEFFFGRKIAYNLMLISASNIIERVHHAIPNCRSIILFGSYRKGDDRETSDVDIAVEVVDGSDLRIKDLGKVNLGYRKNVPIQLHVFSRATVDKNLFANIANGIVLEGFLEARP